MGTSTQDRANEGFTGAHGYRQVEKDEDSEQNPRFGDLQGSGVREAKIRLQALKMSNW